MLWSSSPTANTRAAVLGRPGEHLQPRVLQPVGVLELVDQDVAEAPLVVLAQRVVVAQQLVGAQHQLGEVDHALALALLVVGLVDLDQLAVCSSRDLDVARAQAVFLGAGDEPRHLLGREALLVEVHRLDDALDRRQLVAACRGSGSPAAAPASFQCARRKRLHRPWKVPIHMPRTLTGSIASQPRQHLLGGLVGEGHGQHAAGRDLAGLEQPGDARGQHARLARAGAGEDQRGLGRQRDGGELLGVEVLEQRRRAAADR